jgi:2-hydroxy-3-oxopropionate reductase
MQSCAALGHGQADHSALVLALEAMAGHAVAHPA